MPLVQLGKKSALAWQLPTLKQIPFCDHNFFYHGRGFLGKEEVVGGWMDE